MVRLRPERSKAGSLYSRRMLGGDAFDETAGEPGLLPTKKPSVDTTVVTEGFFDVNGMLALIQFIGVLQHRHSKGCRSLRA